MARWRRVAPAAAAADADAAAATCSPRSATQPSRPRRSPRARTSGSAAAIRSPTAAWAPALRQNVDLYVGCVAGASLEGDYLAMMREAGFRDVEVVSRDGYAVGVDSLAPDRAERAAFDAVVSIKVRAVK